MRSWINVTLFGMLLSTAACFVEDPADPSSTESTEGETESAVIIRPTPVPGPGFYYTCSDQPLVCRAGYGAVEFIPYPDCQPHAAHRVKCVAGATDL